MMSTMTEPIVYTQDNGNEIAELLVGRRIVAAELNRTDWPGRKSWQDMAEGVLILDDGTRLYLTGNDGGCSCGAGDYLLQEVAAVDNIITSARVECLPDSDDDFDDNSESGFYRIYVIADATEINVAEFVGTDGNGYYGTGFELFVVRPQATS